MEDYGYKYFHNLPQFFAKMNSRNNRGIDMNTNHVRNSDFMSKLYSKPLREYERPKFGIGDRVRNSKYDLPFRKGYKPKFTQEIFWHCCHCFYETSNIHNQRRTRRCYTRKNLRERINQSHLSMDSFTIELVSNASSQLFRHNTPSSFKNFLPYQVNLDGQWEVAILEISYPSLYQNFTEGKFMFYDEKISKTTEAYYLEPGLYSSITKVVEAMNTIIKEINNHRDTCITIKIGRVTQKIKVCLAIGKPNLAIFSTDTEHIFWGDMRNDLEILMCGKGSPEPTFAYDFVGIHSHTIYTDIV